MSLNIQTANGLLEIGGSVTKEKVISALGYEPANKAHTEDKTVHVTSAEKETWNNKSDVKHYDDLEGKPSITENNSGNMVVADESGNIIMQVDADGVSTTNVNTKTIELDGKDLGTRLDELEASSLPNILDNETGDLTIADEFGNVIMKIDASGLETTTITAKSAVISGIDIVSKLDEHKEAINDVSGDLTTHTSNSTVHITADERILWNNKSDFSGDYADLTNAPDIVEDNSGEVVYADEAGNVIAKIGENGFETTQVIAETVLANGINVGSTLSSHIGNTDIHITAAERTDWNAKATTTYVDEKVAALVDSSPAALDTLNELAAALGDDPNFAATVTEQIGLKANRTDLDSHTSNKNNPHNVTKAQVGLGNVDNTSDINKPVSTAQQAALDNLKSELSETIVSESKEWIIADEDGNVIARVDENGLETTNVTADAVVVNGIDVETTLANKANSSHIHVISDVTNLQNALDSKATKTYVDEELTKKADAYHVHEEYLVESDIEDLTTKEYVDAELAKKADLNHAHDEYLTADDIVDKADKSELHVHDNKDELDKIIKGKVAYWDAKSEFSGDYNDLTNAPNIYEDSSNNLVIADPEGNIIFRSDSNGFETTTVTAKTVVVNGIDVETALDNKTNKATTLSGYGITDAASKTHTHAISDVTNLQVALDGKADSTHTHDEYLVASDISDKVDKSYVDEQLANKADDNHTHNEYITEGELDAKGYLTQHQDLSDYAKKSEIPEVADNLTTTSSTAALSAAQGAALKTAIDSITGDIGNLGGGDMMKATYDTNNNGIVDNAEKLGGHDVEYFATSDHTHSNYLTADSITDKADISYVDEQLAIAVESANTEASNKDAVILFETQQGINAVRTYVDNELVKKADSTHTHEEYLVANDITNKADKTELHEHLNKDELDKITSGKVDTWDAKASKTYVDEQLETKANSSHYHTLTDVSDITATATELNYMMGVSSGVQLQLDGKANKATTLEGYGITDAASKTYVDQLIDGLTTEGTADAALVQAALTAHTNDKANPHGVTLSQLGVNATAIELSYVSGITSNIQNQINSKANATHTHEQYLTANDITDKADKTYVNSEVDAAKTDASNKDAVVLFEAQKGIDAVQSSLNTHTGNTDAHIMSTERASWNGKADKSYVDDELDKKAEVEHTHSQYLTASNIADKADKSELHNHDNKDTLDMITDDKVSSWDNKSEFSGSYNDLTDAPSVSENESNEFSIVDKDNNIVFRADVDGVHTTFIEADTLVLNSKDIGAKIADIEERLDNLVLITVEDIDAICGAVI